MAGRRGLRALAVGVVLAMASGVVPAAADSPVRGVSVVAGDALTTSISSTASGAQRTATLPGVAALQFATTPAQVRAALRQHFGSLGAESATSQPADRAALDGVFPVGDLDGDRRNDLVLSQYGAGATQFVAVAGDTGRRLWSVDGTAAERWMRDIHVVGLNAKGADGALLLAVTYEEIPSDFLWTLKITVDMTSVAGDGTNRWSRSSSGLVSFSEMGILVGNLSYPAGVGPLNGADDDVLQRTDETAYSLTAGGTSRLEVLDGETGRVGAVLATASHDDAPASGLVGDLDGDGLSDIVTAASGGGRVLVVAHKGTDGRPLWRSELAHMPVYWIDSVGRTNRDPVDDLLLVGVDWEGEQFFSFTVLSGADGAPGLHGAGDGLIPAGDISGDGLDDLLLLKVLFRSKLGVTYEAVTGAGKTVYRRTYALKVPKGSSMASIGMWDVGDLDGDGSLDLAHDISVYGFSERTSAQERGVVLTRNGRKLYDKLVGQSLHASLDGRGDDAVRLRRLASGVEVTAYDGRTNDRLWQRAVGIPGYRGGFAMAADLTRDGRAELLLIGRRAGGAALKVIDGRTNAVRWGR